MLFASFGDDYGPYLDPSDYSSCPVGATQNAQGGCDYPVPSGGSSSGGSSGFVDDLSKLAKTGLDIYAATGGGGSSPMPAYNQYATRPVVVTTPTNYTPYIIAGVGGLAALGVLVFFARS